MKLNKLLALGVVLLAGTSLASCGAQTAEVELGVGYSVSLNATSGKADVTVAVAGFDAAGKILDARFDVVQVTVAKEGDAWVQKGTKTNDNGIKSKLELGSDYNMKGSSGIGLEVDAQIEAFADWTVGKTLAEVKAGLIPGSGHGTPVAEDLTNSVTITVDAFVGALELAYQMKQACGEVKWTGCGVGIATSISAARAGYAELSVTVAGALANKDTVSAAQIDTIVLPINQVEGAYTLVESKYYADGKVLSKAVLKEGYAMAGKATKGEWNVQIDNMEKAIVGATAEELKAQVGEDNKPVADSAIAGATTMTVNEYVAAVCEALEYANLEKVGPQAE